MGKHNRFGLPARVGERTKKLIEAAVKAANGKDEPPPLLKLSWNCKTWGVLPKAGGMGDQSFIEIWRMNLLSGIYDAFYAWNNGMKMTPQQQKIFGLVTEEFKNG